MVPPLELLSDVPRLGSFRIHQQVKRSWHRNRPRVRMLLRWCRRLEFRRIHEQQVLLRIEPHGLGAELGFDLSHLAELVRGILMEDVDKSFPCGNKDTIRFGIIDTGVRARADRNSGIGWSRECGRFE